MRPGAIQSAALVAALGLAACDGSLLTRQRPAPPPAPAPTVTAPPPATVRRPPPQPSDASADLAAFYERLEANLVARGRLRRETDAAAHADALTPDALARTFVRIALFGEYDESGPVLIQRPTETRLHRWSGPVRVELVFGPSVPLADRRHDRAAADRLIGRLAAASGHPISRVPTDGNFTVFVMGEDDRPAMLAGMKDRLPELGPPQIRALETLPRTDFCLVFSSDPGNDGTIARAAALVRAEQTPLLREACLHEEIAQGLGLPNDSPFARPSVFNDDDEFATLTPLDEALLAMLYDPRLVPGMSVEEARPLLPDIAAAALGLDPAG